MATPAVPTDGDLDEPPATSPAASPGRRSPPIAQGSESDHFARFQRFLQLEREGRLNPIGQRRTREREDDEEEEGNEGRGTSGPPPSWDGTTPFEDFNIKARLWIATTKARPRMRGPLILKALSLTPFEVYKHWAKDNQWLQDPTNAEKLLDDMNRPERYGDDR